jgi:phospho-N-acetylmuramoyl-pentapeptide-transferase
MIFLICDYFNFLSVPSIKARIALAALTAFIIVICLGKPMIAWLTQLKYGQAIRQDGPKSHLKKTGTPTMGGLLMVFSIFIATIIWSPWNNLNVWLGLVVLISYGVIGFIDDYLKIKYSNAKGISAKVKIGLQSLVALIVGFCIYHSSLNHSLMPLYIPFTKDLWIPLGVGFIFWAWFIIVGSSNAVNLTDGLDGLAIMPITMIAAALCLLAYVGWHGFIALPSQVPLLFHTSELAVLCSAIVGAGLGFLWFNAYPAQIFMGDVGSLSLGGILGCIALMIHQELVFAIMGGVFVIETLSVILQVGSYKLRNKRIFKMAPIHHHYELKGWPEPKVIVRFWILTIILVLIGLSSLVV